MFRTTSSLPLAAAAVAAALVIAACGSNSPSSTRSSGSGGHLSFAQMQQDAVNFADCMRSRGVPNLPDPTTSPRGFKESLNPSATHSPAFTSAVTTCQHLLPGGGPPNQNPDHSRRQIAAFLAFARCLRGHGFPSFPDPTSTGQLTRQMLANAGIDIHQPAALEAADACVTVTHGVITRTDVARFVAGQ